MAKPDIVLVPIDTLLEKTVEEIPGFPLYDKTCKYIFGGPDGFELQTRKKNRQVVVCIKEIGKGVTLIFEVIRQTGDSSEVVESVSVTDEKNSVLKLPLKKDDVFTVFYQYPEVLSPQPKTDFKVLLKTRC